MLCEAPQIFFEWLFSVPTPRNTGKATAGVESSTVSVVGMLILLLLCRAVKDW